jgi:hypothetical protein
MKAATQSDSIVPELLHVLRTSPTLPAFVGDLALRLVGIADSVEYRAGDGRSQKFAHIVDVIVTGESPSVWAPVRVVLHSDGLLAVLPRYFSEWCEEVEKGNPPIGRTYSLFDFVGLFDHRFFTSMMRARQFCLLSVQDSDAGDALDRAVMTLLGLRTPDWTVAERKCWLRIAPQLIAEYGTMDAFKLALETLIFDAFGSCEVHLSTTDTSKEPLPSDAVTRCGARSKLGVGSYLGERILTRSRCCSVQVRTRHVSTYWAFVSPIDMDVSSWNEADLWAVRVGLGRRLMERIGESFIPVALRFEISAILSGDALCSTLGSADPTSGAILGHTAALN